MTKTKKRQKNEIYEDYWKLTVGNTKFFNKNDTSEKILKLLSERVDNNEVSLLGSNRDRRFYKLQDKVVKISPKSAKEYKNKIVSTRKEINQFIKIGFIEPGITAKHPLVDHFLKAITEFKKRKIFSKIFRTNAKLNCSSTTNKDTRNHIKFLLSTLEEVEILDPKKDIKGLMLCDISKVKKGYLTREELNAYVKKSENIQFKKRKYNQISFLKNFLKKMYSLKVTKNSIQFPSDDDHLFEKFEKINPREKPEYREYRKNLKVEAGGKCMIDGVTEYCIGSHLKPFQYCLDLDLDDEAFDSDNGLYVNRDLDINIDKGKITWTNDGKILFSDNFPKEKIDTYKNSTIPEKYLTPERLKYLEFHRKEIFNVK